MMIRKSTILKMKTMTINDDLMLVRDDKLADNEFVLMYVPDNDDDDDIETVHSPVKERIYEFA